MKPSQIVWIGDDSGLPKANSDVLCGSMVTVSDETIRDNALVPPCFKKDKLNKLAAACGSKWVFKKQRGFSQKELHQSLVMTSELARLVDCPVEYRRWKDIVQEVDNSQLTIQDRTLFVFCWTTEPDLTEVDCVYQALLDQFDVQIRCYPSLMEVHESERKLGDIKAFDEIAAATDIFDYQYRPITCSKTSDCTLEQLFVMKRTHSSSSSHIKLNPKKNQVSKILPCHSKTTSILSDSTPRWFHQQKVNSLVEFGEFGLIIATLPAKDAIDGRAGHVFETFHTKPRAKDVTNPIISVLNRVDDEVLDEQFCGTRTYGDLRAYALWAFEELRKKSSLTTRYDDVHSGMSSNAVEIKSTTGRKRKAPRTLISPPPSSKKMRRDRSSAGKQGDLTDLSSAVEEPESNSDEFTGMFESLEVGARLDIGIPSAEDGHRFFLNEVTRCWYDDLISFKTGDPSTRICSALARAEYHFLFGDA